MICSEEIRQQILDVKKQHKEDKKRKLELTEKDNSKEQEKKQKSELITAYEEEKDKYSHLKKNLPKKGASREQFTLNLLEKFKTKLYDAKEKVTTEDGGEGSKSNLGAGEDSDLADENWLGHELHFEDQTPVLAKDAATKKDDWYDVYDPRNPLNKRRREATKPSKK